MKNQKMNISVIGTGGRSCDVIKRLLNTWNQIEVSSVFDPDLQRIQIFLNETKSQNAKICKDYLEAVNNPTSSWCFIFSPNCYHKEHIIASFKAGKHVFAEKPLATTIKDCIEIYKAHKKTNLIFATGFVLRYAPIYRKAKEILQSGTLGKIISIAASENITPSHGSYIMKNWRRFAKFAGPHILEKCCHDLDLLNWFTESLPSKVASFGGLNLFTPDNADLPQRLNEKGKKEFEGWFDPAGFSCPFKSDKDIIDHHCAAFIFKNGISGTFQATLSNAIPERRIYFSCSEGTMITELYSQKLIYARVGENIAELPFSGDLHGGGDSILAKEIGETVLLGKLPPTSADEGLCSSIFALSVEESRLKNKIINLEPIWKKLNM